MAVWRTIWEQHEHVVCRIYHTERLVRVQDQQGQWIQGTVAQAQEQMRTLARVETTRGAYCEERSDIPNDNRWRWKLPPVLSS